MLGETTATTGFNFKDFVVKNALWIGLGLAIIIAVIVYFVMKPKKRRSVRGLGAPRRRTTKRRTRRKSTGRRRKSLKGGSELAKVQAQNARLKGQIASLGKPKTRRRRKAA